MQRSENSRKKEAKAENISHGSSEHKKDADLKTERERKPILKKAAGIKELVCCGWSISDSFNGLVSHKGEEKKCFPLGGLHVVNIQSPLLMLSIPFLDAPAAFLGNADAAQTRSTGPGCKQQPVQVIKNSPLKYRRLSSSPSPSMSSSTANLEKNKQKL